LGGNDYVVESVLGTSGDSIARDNIEAICGLDDTRTEFSCRFDASSVQSVTQRAPLVDGNTFSKILRPPKSREFSEYIKVLMELCGRCLVCRI